MARDEADIAGFAILQNIGSENQCLRLRRIAVQDAGHGIGSRFLHSLLKICFDDLGAHRVELFVFEDNERAYRAYLKNGFVEEGIVRDIHRDAEGTFRSMRLMSLLRSEWNLRHSGWGRGFTAAGSGLQTHLLPIRVSQRREHAQ
ncbi:GNAT family N-acetyltransferase [Bradyrhizobium retamae]|uniref:GNAT family N-acetyltransferase n=1 Tax=Bradyrhizobium retamae TaxID=1300035 RepID=UPI003D3200A0